MVRQSPPQCFCAVRRLRAVDQEDEFLAAPARREFVARHSLGQDRRHRAQDGVAGVMAVGIVDAFEVVDIEHQQGTRRQRGPRCEPDEAAAVGESGERVGVRQAVEFAVGGFEFGGALAHPRFQLAAQRHQFAMLAVVAQAQRTGGSDEQHREAEHRRACHARNQLELRDHVVDQRREQHDQAEGEHARLGVARPGMTKRPDQRRDQEQDAGEIQGRGQDALGKERQQQDRQQQRGLQGSDDSARALPAHRLHEFVQTHQRRRDAQGVQPR
ncbi:MAG TPA: hypothetical protein PLB00_12430 [Pseudomonadota bacterium]|nr:hypothetical protein [Pseudomonadota bacterium]